MCCAILEFRVWTGVSYTGNQFKQVRLSQVTVALIKIKIVRHKGLKYVSMCKDSM